MKDTGKFIVQGAGTMDFEAGTAAVEKWLDDQPKAAPIKAGFSIKATIETRSLLDHLHSLFETKELCDAEFKLEVQVEEPTKARAEQIRRDMQPDLFDRDDSDGGVN